MNRHWIVYPKPRDSSQLRLFCFPFAGAGPHVYYPWSHEVPPEIEIAAVQLPGHGARLDEKPWEDLAALIPTLCEGLAPHLTKPFAFFGHSLGALLSFEVARELRRTNRPSPAYLFASGRQAPHIKTDLIPVHALRTNELIDVLRRFQGMPEVLLDNKEMLDLFLPIIRADFILNESYVYANEVPLRCPISAFGGIDDQWVGSDDVTAWGVHTEGSFNARLLPGHHFFIQSSRSELIQSVCNDLLSVQNFLGTPADGGAFNVG